jgi:cysteinyl-tRNA synthetase
LTFLFRNFLEQIIDNGCAYVVNGDVYFSVDNFPEYGKLSGRKLDDNRAGERVAVDERKKNPADFALWKVIHVFISFLYRIFLCLLSEKIV